MTLNALDAALTLVIVPPVNLAILALLALWWGRRRIALAALLALYILATPLVAGSLIRSLETGLPDTTDPTAAQAILVLGGDIDRDSQDRVIPGALTLERLRAGAALARATGLPLAVTGGPTRGGGPAIGTVMALSLAKDFGTPARWVETHAADTWENARNSAALLRPEGIERVFLVTHAWHMRRSLLAFRATDLQAIPAPLWIDGAPRLDLSVLVPRLSGWVASYYALHEWVGIAWYELRGNKEVRLFSKKTTFPTFSPILLSIVNNNTRIAPLCVPNDLQEFYKTV